MKTLGNASRLYAPRTLGQAPQVNVAYTDLANIFTLAQQISSANAGTLLTLTSTDADAGQGPDIVADRNSPSPAANDLIGALMFRGRDSGGNATEYVRFRGVIIDPTNGSEDGRAVLFTMQGGTETAAMTWEQGATVGAPTGGDKGVGTLNAAAGVYIAGHGTIAQVVNDVEQLLVTSASNIPNDDTIPQNTEGVEVLSVAITPTNASSVLEIEVIVQLGASTTINATAALFVDSTANALAAAGTRLDASWQATVAFIHRVSAASTSSRTYKVRVGLASGTVSLNGVAGVQRYGGVASSSITVREILPQ